MLQVDIVGLIFVSQCVNGCVVMVVVNLFVFKQLVFVGDLLSFYVIIMCIGNMLIMVDVEVYVQCMCLMGEVVKVIEVMFMYVVIGLDCKLW